MTTARFPDICLRFWLRLWRAPGHPDHPPAAAMAAVLAAGLGLVTSSATGCRTPAPVPAPLTAYAGTPAPDPTLSAKPGPLVGGDLLKRAHFADSHWLPWMTLFIPPAKGGERIEHAAMCLDVDAAGKNAWDVQLRHREMTIRKGHGYTVRFKAWASRPTAIRAKVGMSGAPYREYFARVIDLDTQPRLMEARFTSEAPDDPTAELAFHLGGDNARPPVRICFDDLHLVDPEFTPAPPAPEVIVPPVRVNQLGYLTAGPKRATWVIGPAPAKGDGGDVAVVPAAFQLLDAKGAVVYRGETGAPALDPASGDLVAIIDFSPYQRPGRGLRLRVTPAGGGGDAGAPRNEAGGLESDAFDVSPDGGLGPLARAALRYFYQNRSGVPLRQPFTEGAAWERGEGHPSDHDVRCAADAGCDYALDVSGGWYDAGDYGKYVVNGGLSVWLLMNLHELGEAPHAPRLPALRDGALHVPESGNGQSDLLDEARWELEWMLKMQVPEGRPHAGMAHHKMHDERWTSLAVLPVATPDVRRVLRPVSTAATLNLAAAAAQGARVFAASDPAFARRCRAAAERAFRAAAENPLALAPASDREGGGSYEDDHVEDERYWAAAELYVTTGDERYLALVKASPFLTATSRQAAGVDSTFSWDATDALGTMSLALAARAPAELRQRARSVIVQAAEAHTRTTETTGFGEAFGGTQYPWGSNGAMVANGVVMAYAHWLTKEPRFLRGAVAALDYVLGRNALGKSYVSGFGARPLEQPHHRFWSHALDPKFPGPPPGALAGGPNTRLQDPYARGGLSGCVGQRCYVDNIDAPSLNEVAINWNASLAWLAAYVSAAGAPARAESARR